MDLDQKMSKEKAKLEYEVTEGNVFAALGRKNADELLTRAELLGQVSSLIKKKRTYSTRSRQETKHIAVKNFYAHYWTIISV